MAFFSFRFVASQVSRPNAINTLVMLRNKVNLTNRLDHRADINP